MTDLDFFFDPVCPWAWITSRWVTEVQSLRSYDVSWKFISLKFLNEEKMDYSTMPEGYADVHMAGTKGLRVAACARAKAGNDAVAKVYTALGTSLHVTACRYCPFRYESPRSKPSPNRFARATASLYFAS